MTDALASDDLYIDLHGNEIYFSTHEKISIASLVESLKGLEKIVSQSGNAFSNLLEVGVNNVEVFVEKLEEGSLTETIVLRVFFENEDEMAKFFAKWRHKLKDMEPMKATGVCAGLVIAAMAGYGLYRLATTSSAPAPAANQTTLNIVNSNINIIGAEAYDKSPEEFAKIVEESVQDPKSLAKNSLKFIDPAKKSGGDISFSSGSSTPAVITHEAVGATPDKADFSPKERSVEYKDIGVQVRATDLDSHTKGWAAVIPRLVDRRVPMQIENGIDVNELSDNRVIRADVTVEYRFDARLSGDKYKPTKIILENIVKDDPESV